MRPEERKQIQSNMLGMSGSIAIIAIVLIGVLFLKILGGSARAIDTKYIKTDEVKLVDNTLEIKGDCLKSRLVYDNHEYELNGNILFLKVYFSKAEDFSPKNNFEIVIEDESLTGVDLVVLRGKSADDQKHIWEREEP